MFRDECNQPTKNKEIEGMDYEGIIHEDPMILRQQFEIQQEIIDDKQKILLQKDQEKKEEDIR